MLTLQYVQMAFSQKAVVQARYFQKDQNNFGTTRKVPNSTKIKAPLNIPDHFLTVVIFTSL